jgi:SAM-dependent methyltransferase
MDDPRPGLQKFVSYVHLLRGYEKGEAQVLCDRFFQAFGHEGYKEAGAELEFPVKAGNKSPRFADLVWKPRLLLEMKKRGAALQDHYRQAFNYWLELVPKRPKYVVLSNFDEFWIYDFDLQLEEPVDVVRLDELPDRFTSFNFMFPDERQPLFGNDRVAVTREAADKVATTFNLLVKRGEPRERAQRFVLQTVVALFSEDVSLLPRGFVTQLIEDCISGESSYDLLGGLFHQMNSPAAARGGRYKDVAYFNGGIFGTVEPIDLDIDELELLRAAADEDWSKVQPQVFGTLFQSSMDEARRHAHGAHFTSEADIQKVVQPTIVLPWQERIGRAKQLRELREIRNALVEFRVLDPACGSGNFLYVAYRELKRLEVQLINRIRAEFSRIGSPFQYSRSFIQTTQFYGIDRDPFAVELARVTLSLAKELAINEARQTIVVPEGEQAGMSLQFDPPLPLDNLDKNIICTDALLTDWPEVDAIIGNPPFQSKNKIQRELGPAYINRVRERYPEVPGHADYCVYWFKRTHDELKEGARAGLVGTNTIRQNQSRKGGLDYIVKNGGTITEAVASQVWSGDAEVNVSIVNWVKGKQQGKKRLFEQLGDNLHSPWTVKEVGQINSALSFEVDVTQAKRIKANSDSRLCSQGQTHGHEAFILSITEAEKLVNDDNKNAEVIFPFMIADDLLGQSPPRPTRFAIDFHPRDLIDSAGYAEPFARIKSRVLPDRQLAAEEERVRNRELLESNDRARVNRHHENFLKRWWLFSYPRPDLIKRLTRLPRYIVCGQVTKRPIFEFLSPKIRPNAALMVFPLSDDYSFGVLQSSLHWLWFKERCSTLKRDPRYTSTTVFETFPWPQAPSVKAIEDVSRKGRDLRQVRLESMRQNCWSLRELYRTLDLPGDNRLRRAQNELDEAINAAYGISNRTSPLEYLLDLNLTLAQEGNPKSVTAPGLPPSISNVEQFVSSDCIDPEVPWDAENAAATSFDSYSDSA